MKLGFLFLLFLFVSCQPKVNDPKIIFVPVEICKVDNKVCVEYIFPSYLNESLCQSEGSRYAGSSAVLTKNSSCPQQNVAGKCARSSDKIYYYLSDFTAGHAQTECNSRSGTFEQ